MIRFLWPEAWLLLLPAAAVMWRLARGWGRATGVLRCVVVVLLIAALAGPQVRLGGQGMDVIVVVDRSASMTEQHRKEADELIATLMRDRGDGDRVGVVAFAQRPRLTQQLQAGGSFTPDGGELGPNGSNLAAGLDTALPLLRKDRPGRVLILSDGETTGPDVMPSARRAAAADVPIDYIHFERPRTGDVAVAAMQLPAKVDQDEPFQFSAIVHSDREVEVGYTLNRPGSAPIKGTRKLAPGVNRLTFRDSLGNRGVVGYELALDTPEGDRPGNNIARGVVHVQAPPAILVVNNTGAADNLTRALSAGDLEVKTASAAAADLSLEHLAGFRAVVLENVSANDIGSPAMRALETFVTDMGGGLMMTGGKRSFGAGGYYLSPLQPVLPVTMELRKEHRKLSMALAIVMDRSGSMSMPVPGGKSKMDLANLAAAESVKLLSDMDSVAVIPVDSAAHISVPLTSASQRDKIVKKIMRIESMGGGIFVYTGLAAAGKQLERAPQGTRHIILFADAADAEEPGNYKELLKHFEKMGITVSVIGLGTKGDPDAAFLEDIAKRGHGQVFFSTDAKDLPRLFSQDTMSIARNTFVADPVGTKTFAPPLRLLGQYRGPAIGDVGGYNLCYMQPKATMGAATTDEFTAPVVAFWNHGLGRSMAFTAEVDGEHTGPLLRWGGYADFFITTGRWLLGAGEPDGVRVTMDRRGATGVVRLEVDPERVDSGAVAPFANVFSPGDTPARTKKLPLRWISDSVAEATFDLEQTGSYQAVVGMGGDRLLKSGALTLPYSPEFAPRLDQPPGREVLASIAGVSGGGERLGIEGVLEPTARRRTWAGIAPILLLLAMLAVVAEIAGRRLMLWNAAAFAWIGRASRRAWRRIPRPSLPSLPRRKQAPAPTPDAPVMEVEPLDEESTPPPPAPAPPKPKRSALDRAKNKAKRRF